MAIPQIFNTNNQTNFNSGKCIQRLHQVWLYWKQPHYASKLRFPAFHWNKINRFPVYVYIIILLSDIKCPLIHPTVCKMTFNPYNFCLEHLLFKLMQMAFPQTNSVLFQLDVWESFSELIVGAGAVPYAAADHSYIHCPNSVGKNFEIFPPL